MLTNPSAGAYKEEAEIIDNLFRCIDNYESFLFDAGAGAGKTYALVECLKHAVKTKAPVVTRNGQKIVCITYTNVAANEVIERLGKSDIVAVSTIHDFMWNFIKRFQQELLEVHKGKMKKEITRLTEELYNADKCVDLGDRFEQIKQLLSDNTDEYLDIHYKSPRAKDYRNRIRNSEQLGPQLENYLSNVAKIKKTAKNLIDICRLEKCISSIVTGIKKEVRYNTFSNSDRLYRMQISHDTVLEYCRQILSESDEIKRLFADSFPFVFIDEYQDTHIDVVIAIENVLNFTKEKDRAFLVGFFGDKAQRIYYENNESVEKIVEIQALKRVEKKHNRRSAKEIIDVANKIRNDEIEQISIFDDTEGGSCRFYRTSLSMPYEDILAKLKGTNPAELGNEPLDIFILSNKKVAEKAGFMPLYEIFHNSQYYKFYYDRLNSELMSKSERNLGEAPRVLRNLIDLRHTIENKNEKLTALLPKQALSEMTTKELRKVLSCVSGIEASNLAEYMDNLVASIALCESEELRENVKKVFANRTGIDAFDRATLEVFLTESLCFESGEGEGEEKSADSTVLALMGLDISIYDAWFDFLANSNASKLGFHTFHGTKGDEYDRVLAIAGNRYTDSSRSPRSYFDLYFERYSNSPSELSEDELKHFREAQNLLYVAVTRAKKHFSFVYQTDEELNPVSRSNIEYIFGDIFEIQ